MEAEKSAPEVAREAVALIDVMDERDGVTYSMKVVGTLAALDLAAAHGLVNLQTTFDRLRATTFRSPLRLMGSMQKQDVERRKRQRDRQ